MSRRIKVFFAAGLDLAVVGLVVWLSVVWFKAINTSAANATSAKEARISTVRSNAVVAQIAVFKTMLGAFRDDTGFYPTRTNGLQGLIRQPAGAMNWHGPYAQDIPKDPWGREYLFEIPGKHASSGYPYDLFSLGPILGTNVIANWAVPSLKP